MIPRELIRNIRIDTLNAIREMIGKSVVRFNRFRVLTGSNIQRQSVEVTFFDVDEEMYPNTTSRWNMTDVRLMARTHFRDAVWIIQVERERALEVEF